MPIEKYGEDMLSRLCKLQCIILGQQSVSAATPPNNHVARVWRTSLITSAQKALDSGPVIALDQLVNRRDKRGVARAN